MGLKLLTVTAVLAAALLNGSTAFEYDFLERFNNVFGNYSAETEPIIQNLRRWNSDVIEEFNRELLLQFARLVTASRAADAAFLQEITLTDDLDEDCLEEVLWLRQFYLNFQNWDVRLCASSAWYGLNEDTTNRFFPYHNPFARENSRAVYQTVQTLGRRSIYDVEGLQYELQEQLDYYLNLRDGQTELLWDEIAAHVDAAYVIYWELDTCREWSLYLQQGDHNNIRPLLENNCWYDVESTEETTIGTTTEIQDESV